MRSRLSWVICLCATLAASSVSGQEGETESPAFATLCMVEWSIGPIWAGGGLGCPPVVQPLSAPNRPCRKRYSTSAGTAEEALLRYDVAGRLSQVENVGHGRADYVYDAEGRLTTHTHRPRGYPATTTSFVYTPGSRSGDYAISEEPSSSDYRNRWQIEAGRIHSSVYMSGASTLTTNRWVYESEVFVRVETIPCRGASSDASCVPSGPPSRMEVTRDRNGRIQRWTNGDVRNVYTYDSRGRLTRIRGTSARLQDDTRIDYVCPER